MFYHSENVWNNFTNIELIPCYYPPPPTYKEKINKKFVCYKMASKTNKQTSDEDFEEQSHRHFAIQFGSRSKTNTNISTTACSDADDDFDNESNALLREIQIPQYNYWDFSAPCPNRYANLPNQPDINTDYDEENDSELTLSENDADSAENQENINTIAATTTERKRFRPVSDQDLAIFLKEQENKNTARKTKSDMKLFQTFLKEVHNESRPIESIDPTDLDRYVSLFFLSATKTKCKNGTIEYEPSSLNAMQASINRYLIELNYGWNIMSDDEFHRSRNTLSAKFKNLKLQGLGNKPLAADPLTDEDLNKFYSKDLMGTSTPRSLLNTIYINNNYHFGLRGVTEHYNLCWGDITLKVDTNGDEYLQYTRERQTKTRQGDDVTNIRKKGPIAMENKEDRSRCPVFAYKLFSQKRPIETKQENSPFYIQVNTIQHENFKSKLYWYKKQRLGEKSIATIIKTMAKEGLPGVQKRLTGHSARKGAIQKQKDAGVQDTEIIERTGHKNVQSLLSYSTTNLEQQKKTSLMLSSTSNKSQNDILEPKQTKTMVDSKNDNEHVVAKKDEEIFANQRQDVAPPQINTSQQAIYNFQHLHPAMSGFFSNASFHGGQFNFNFNTYTESSSKADNDKPKRR